MPTPPRRRPPTIDLKATEVMNAAAADAGSSSPSGKPSGTDTPPADPAESPPIGSPPDEHGSERASAEAPQPRAPRTGVRPAVVIAAGIAGASVAVVAGALVWGLGLLPPSIRLANNEALAPVMARIAGLQHQLEQLEARPAPASLTKLQETQAQLAKLEAEVAHQHDVVEAGFAKLEAAAAAPSLAPQLADVQAQVAKLEAKTAAPAVAVDQALADRISALDRRLDQTALTARDAASRAGAAEQAARANSGAEAAARLQGSLDGLATRVDALQSSSAGMEQRLAKVTTVAAADRAFGLGLAALELRIAVERGTPFADELAAVKPLLSDPSLVAPLEGFVSTGVPSAASLSQDLTKLEPSILRANERADHGSSVLSRLEARAGRLIRIRPVDAPPGDDPETVLARAGIEAGRGDIAGAVADLERLPENLRAPAAGWIKAANARVAALDAARRLSASALAALTKPAP